MDTHKIVKQFRLSGWGEAVKERVANGQSVRAFCKENGIGTSTYYYRQRKVREAACAEFEKVQKSKTNLVPSGWAQLTEVEPELSAEKSLTIEIGGCNITVNDQTDPELLLKVCRTLRSI